MKSFVQQLKALSSAEEFLQFFGIPFDQKIVNVSRLHILKRFFQYIQQQDALPESDEAALFASYHALLLKAYGDFVTSTPAQEKVFKVFGDKNGRQHVSLDSLRASLPPRAPLPDRRSKAMHIVVCIKQVPDSTQIRVHPVTNTIMRQGVPAIVNPYDLFSLEEALRLKDRFGGKVTMLCMGPPQAEEALRKCISFGADDAVLLTDRAFAGADTLATSYALAAGIQQIAKDQAVDIVFTGKQTIDGDTAQVGPGIAKRLGLQLLTYVSRIVETALDARTITVERRAEGGVQVLRTALPCLITMLENTNELRFATLPAMMHAAGCPVRKWNCEQAGIEDLSKIGLKGSPTVVSKVFGPTPRSEKAEILDLDASSLCDVSVNLLRKIFTRHPTLEADLLMKEGS